jgi:hypothetical protein
MLPKGVAVALQTGAIDGSEGVGDAGAHAPEIAWRKSVGIPVADSTARFNPPGLARDRQACDGKLDGILISWRDGRRP